MKNIPNNTDLYIDIEQKLENARIQERNKTISIIKLLYFILLLSVLFYSFYLTPRMRITTNIPRTALCQNINITDIVDLCKLPN
jgi:hypothetical protein